MIKIAVLMSTYNGEKYLKEQIDSILNQKGNFELHLIVRDDGSSDSTTDILNMYKTQGMLEWYKGANLRTAKSFLDLLYYHHDYDYYAFADQDDFWLEGKIQRGVDSIKNVDSPCLYFSNAELVNFKLEPLGVKAYRHKMSIDFYSSTVAPCYLGCTFIFNKKLAEIIQNNRIPEIISMHDSYLARVCISVGGRIYYDSFASIDYRQHETNVIGTSTSIIDGLKRRIKTITEPAPIRADKQMKEIINIYGKLIDPDKMEWLQLIANYRKGLNRFKLAFSSKPKFISKNMKLVTMLSILFGNY